MPIVVKPNSFTGQAAPQLPWIDSVDDVLYNLVNGALDDDNIKANALIAQSKIANLVTDLAARLNIAGGEMTGFLHIFAANPTLYLEDSAGTEFAIQSTAGGIIIYKNTGTHAAPVYEVIYTLSATGAPVAATDLADKAYVDASKPWLVDTVAPSTPVANTLYRDLIVKGWVKTSGAGLYTIDADVNVASITINSAGNFALNWATPFANANYVVIGAPIFGGGSEPRYLREDFSTPKTASSVRLKITGTSGIEEDPAVGVSVFAIGAQ